MIGTQLRARLVGVEQHMAKLEEQMAKLEEQMMLLEDEKQTIEDDLGAIVSPKVSQHKIPTEIMSMIFVEVKHADDNPYVVHDLFSVCSCWHEIVKNTCHLYTDLLCGHVAELTTYTARAGSFLPLALEFHLSPLSSSESQELRDILVQHASQWATLFFIAPSGAGLPSDLSAGSFTRLTTLWLKSPLAESVELPQLAAPRLQSLKLQCRSLGTGWQAKFPWKQITTLDVNDGISQWWHILAETPNLERLVVKDDSQSDDDGDDTTPSIPVLLPRLHTLFFQGVRDSRMRVGLLEYLTLPALETLKIPFRLLYADPLALGPFFERSNCSVRTLDLFLELNDLRFDFDHPQAVSRVLWRHFATVRDLTLRAASPPDLDLLLTCMTGNSGEFLPSLESLALLECRLRIKLAQVVDMLSARAWRADNTSTKGTPPKKLTSFTLRYSDGIHDFIARGVDADLRQLRKLRADGLDVDIGSDFKSLDGCIDLKMIDVISRGEDYGYDESDEEPESYGEQDSGEGHSGEEQDSNEEQESEDDSDSEAD